MLFFTGFPRNASDIAAEQIRTTPRKKKELDAMKGLVDESLNVLNGGKDDLLDFAGLLHETWKIKRTLTPNITNSFIDEVYETAIKAGALGGKLLGAGGGGFMLFFAEPDRQRNVREKLGKLLYVPFRFQNLGSQIIYYAPEEDY